MMKVKIVNSSYKLGKKNGVHPLLQGLTFPKGIHVSYAPAQPIFIVVESPQFNLIGGACLLKKELWNVYKEIGLLTSSLISKDQSLWECPTIYVDTSIYFDQPLTDQQDFLKQFYQKLYEGLVEFGAQKGIFFLVVKLFHETYTATRDIGLWPYVVEFKPEESSDGLFHGILPLRGRLWETYKSKILQEPEPSKILT